MAISTPVQNSIEATATQAATISSAGRKNGERRNFTLDNIPDSTWVFVDAEAGGQSEDASCSVFDSDGEEVNRCRYKPGNRTVICGKINDKSRQNYVFDESKPVGNYCRARTLSTLLPIMAGIGEWS